MTVGVQTTMQSIFELADEVGALPRAGGVQVVYGQPGLWGFEGAGEPWDTAPFRGQWRMSDTGDSSGPGDVLIDRPRHFRN